MAEMATEPTLAIRAFPGDAALGGLVIKPSASTRPYLEKLAAGQLTLQRCTRCGRCRNPIAPVCPYCGGMASDWSVSDGRGDVVSWVRYPRSYLPEFERLVPYVVLCVELAERVRMFGRLAETGIEPRIGMRVHAIIERWADGGLVPAFVPDEAR
jgi:uncharacterized OB-fold protein